MTQNKTAERPHPYESAQALALMEALSTLQQLLEEERGALIQQSGDVIETLAKSKARVSMCMNGLLNDPDLPKSLTADQKLEIQSAVKSIRSLQETNTLLARQTLAYLSALKEALAPQVPGSGPSLYEKTGTVPLETTSKSGWLDQSV